MSGTASSLLSRLGAQKVAVSIQGSGLRVEAPRGVINRKMRDDLQRHKPELVALLQLMDRVSALSLQEFANCHFNLELRVPHCRQTIWWVPTSRAALELVQRGIHRGRIWTAEELHRVWAADLKQDDVQTLARIKTHLECELQSFLPLDDGQQEKA